MNINSSGQALIGLQIAARYESCPITTSCMLTVKPVYGDVTMYLFTKMALLGGWSLKTSMVQDTLEHNQVV